MPNNRQSFKSKLIKTFGKDKYYNGERDFANGFVEAVFKDGDTLFGVVINHTFTRKHNVKVSINDITQNVCSCSSGGHCRHVIATLVAYHTLKDDVPLLREYINVITALPKSDIETLLYNTIVENPKIALQINFFLELNKLDLGNYPQVIENILELTLNLIEYNDYNVEVMLKRLEQLFKRVKETIEPANDPKKTFESYFYICKRTIEFMKSIPPSYVFDYIDLIKNNLIEPIIDSMRKLDSEYLDKYIKDVTKISVFDYLKGRTGAYRFIEYIVSPKNYRTLLAIYMKWLSKKAHLGEWMYFHDNYAYTRIVKYILNTLYMIAEKSNSTKQDVLEYFSKISKPRGFYVYLKIFELLLEEEKNIELALFFAERIIFMWFPDTTQLREKEFGYLQHFLIKLTDIQPNLIKGYKIEQFLLNLMKNHDFLKFLDEHEQLRIKLKEYLTSLGFTFDYL